MSPEKKITHFSSLYASVSMGQASMLCINLHKQTFMGLSELDCI